MKKTRLVLAAALSCIALSAAATESHSAKPPRGAVGTSAAARAEATARANVKNTNRIGIATTVGLGVTTGATTATGGSIAPGALTVGGDTYQAAASPSFAPGAHGPLKSCRLYAGLGAGSRDGTGSAGLPIGNDQVCITDANHEIMDRENARAPGTFSRDDYLRASCKVEGMSETQACKALAGQQSAAAPVGMAYTPN